ncbi:hypothetical protein [Solirubrobacter pauli]|uniref:hypothetical protein n=1 Tax=Solirubrobacter pauli TaxID=166793 RepID=UPI0011C41052|nr:hypothetical protein [Solirubrobacter pauli]
MLAPIVILFTVLAAVDGLWLGALSGLLVTVSGVTSLRSARRRGISWNWPRSWRELREYESPSTPAPSARD